MQSVTGEEHTFRSKSSSVRSLATMRATMVSCRLHLVKDHLPPLRKKPSLLELASSARSLRAFGPVLLCKAPQVCCVKVSGALVLPTHFCHCCMVQTNSLVHCSL